MDTRRLCLAQVGLAAALFIAAHCGTFAATVGITSLRKPGDSEGPEFLRRESTLGEVVVRYRTGREAWREVSTRKVEPARQDPPDGSVVFSATYSLEGGLTLDERFTRRAGALLWTLRFGNTGPGPIEIGDIALPLPMNTEYPRAFAGNPEETFKRRVFRHAFISGHGSFLFWLPVGGVGPHLVMTPTGRTKLEYFTDERSDYAHGGGRYTVFIHSAASGAAERRGTWRQRHTSLTLAPGAQTAYGFRFAWGSDYDDVRGILVESGGFDVRVAGGMVVPIDLSARFSLHTRCKIEAVTAEFPDETILRPVGRRGDGIRIYEVRFSHLGENLVTVRYDQGKSMYLEFFATQPLETLIKKRAAFIAAHQQHRDPALWYDGLFSLWDVRLPEGKNLLGPDNLGGQLPYAVSGSDDPSNSKGIFLAEKNVAYPDRREIEALEYFLKNFVWGKHQRTDKEQPHPYGIYGCPSWHACRLSKTGLNSGGHGQERMWRTFDYTTYFALYYNMYRIARQAPEMVKYLDARGYLRRAFGTAKAYFTVPYSIKMGAGWSFHGWCDWAYKIGNFHEKYLLGIIDALEEEGWSEEARWLRGEWEKKVKYFLYDDPYPYVSEMPVDSTAYESSYAIARYALTHELTPDEKLWRDKNSGKWYSHPKIDPERHRDFLRRQLLANLACRGWLETSYYHLGSDFRALGSSGYTLSYMSQMGGWAVLDYALRFAPDPSAYVRLGYASMLSSWALVNAGTPASNWGAWYPGKRHDGAASWGFLPKKFGSEWNPATRGIPRGPWPVDGEIDHGLTAGVQGASTVVLDDPVFGLFAYGGILGTHGDKIRVTPRDGVRQRLCVITATRRIHVRLRRDGFARDRDITIERQGDALCCTLENRTGTAHSTILEISGLPPGLYVVSAGGKPLARVTGGGRRPLAVKIPLKGASLSPEISIQRDAR